jgi:BirA family transcriptional regulator, biotin operon repressor / biotin---[acetyl-CoA-carboxylase] ligase
MTTAHDIRRLLTRRGLSWPAAIERLDAVGSTNEWLKEQARAGAAAFSAVVADAQTAGRGRHGRAWVSRPGDLALSLLVRPPSRAEALLLLPLAAGVAVAEAAAELGAQPSLKWPNDVVVARGRGEDAGYAKLAGILVEGVSEGGRVAAVIGVGMNLVPREERHGDVRAACLEVEAGREISRDAAAAAVLAHLSVWYDAVACGEAGAVASAFTARALPWWGRAVEVRSGETTLRGIARGIDGRGALLLELEDGSTVAVVSGEARQVRLR